VRLNITPKLLLISAMVLIISAPVAKSANWKWSNLQIRASKATTQPVEKIIKVSIDGYEKSFNFKLYNSRQYDITPAFTTYTPVEFTEDLLSSGEGTAVIWTSALGKQLEEQAFLQITVTNAASSEVAGRKLIKEIAESRGTLTVDPEKFFPWSLAEYKYAGAENGKKVTGIVMLVKHGKRFQVIIVQQPDQYKREFLPLVKQLLAEWKWQDIGLGFRN
jgi:hypothetical protein